MRSILMLAVSVIIGVVVVAGCGVDSTTGSVTSSAGSSPAPAVDYVNIGDSFSAGAGLGKTVEDSNLFCQRSTLNFAHIIAARRGLVLDDVSCSGADTIDLDNSQYLGVPPQLDALRSGSRPQVVTVMIGGNNADVFSDTIEWCGDAAADDPTGDPCTQRYGDELFEPIRTNTFPSLRIALRQIKTLAPGARIVVIGYPYLVPRTAGCYPSVRIARGDIPTVRRLERTLNDSIRRAANESGVTFVDAAAASAGRDACAAPDVRWIEPQVGSRTAATLHPNERGMRAIADMVSDVL